MQKICINQNGFGQGMGATNAQNRVKISGLHTAFWPRDALLDSGIGTILFVIYTEVVYIKIDL